jgi:hypothetical protein
MAPVVILQYGIYVLAALFGMAAAYFAFPLVPVSVHAAVLGVAGVLVGIANVVVVPAGQTFDLIISDVRDLPLAKFDSVTRYSERRRRALIYAWLTACSMAALAVGAGLMLGTVDDLKAAAGARAARLVAVIGYASLCALLPATRHVFVVYFRLGEFRRELIHDAEAEKRRREALTDMRRASPVTELSDTEPFPLGSGTRSKD